MTRRIPFFPEQASSAAPAIDTLFYTLLAFSFALGILLSWLVIGYAVRYRKGSRADRSGRITRSFWLEASWIGASLVIAFTLFGWGAVLFLERNDVPRTRSRSPASASSGCGSSATRAGSARSTSCTCRSAGPWWSRSARRT